MPQRPHPTQFQRPRRLGMLHMISYQCDSRVGLVLLVIFAGELGRGGGECSRDGGRGFADAFVGG